MSLAMVLAALPPELSATVVRDGARTVVAAGTLTAIRTQTAGHSGFDSLNALDRGWWAGFVSYDAGRSIERVVDRQECDPTAETTRSAAIPDLHFVQFAARAVVNTDGQVAFHGERAERRALERAFTAPATVATVPESEPWSMSLDRLEYEQRVRAIQALIRAGECYQVNLTRQLVGPELDAIALYAATESGNPAPHAMFWRDGAGLAIASASPEQFLLREGSRVQTRPIKGTAVRAARLRTSEKDRAENVMIVDLARNDLGRVCVPGSIEVPELCRVETHPGLVHLVSTVRGELRPGVGFGSLLRATFPPASITGAPKPRVMQAIEDLEPVRRGIYCGAVGWIDADCERAELAVAIRTFTCTETETTFGVGAGITIDSDPAGEWSETELKATRLLALAGEQRSDTVTAAQS